MAPAPLASPLPAALVIVLVRRALPPPPSPPGGSSSRRRRPARRSRSPLGAPGRPAVPGAQPRLARGRGQRGDPARPVRLRRRATGTSSRRSAAAPGDTTRIAWAGPARVLDDDRAEPAARSGAGTALCHFKDGEVVASYSTPPSSRRTPTAQMTSAACNGPERLLVRRASAPRTRPASASAPSTCTGTATLDDRLRAAGPRGHATSSRTAGRSSRGSSSARRPGDSDRRRRPGRARAGGPRLLHRIVRRRDRERPVHCRAPPTACRTTAAELLALDGDGTQLWAVGGGAASGPRRAPARQLVARPPLAARLDGTAPGRSCRSSPAPFARRRPASSTSPRCPGPKRPGRRSSRSPSGQHEREREGGAHRRRRDRRR